MANLYKSVLASGGGVAPTGDAQVGDVLAGKTFSNADGIDKTGTMVNNGAVSKTLAFDEVYTVPAGYHNGSGTVTAPSASTLSPTIVTGGMTADWTPGSNMTIANCDPDTDLIVFSTRATISIVSGGTVLDSETIGGAISQYVVKPTATEVVWKIDSAGWTAFSHIRFS